MTAYLDESFVADVGQGCRRRGMTMRPVGGGGQGVTASTCPIHDTKKREHIMYPSSQASCSSSHQAPLRLLTTHIIPKPRMHPHPPTTPYSPPTGSLSN